MRKAMVCFGFRCFFVEFSQLRRKDELETCKVLRFPRGKAVVSLIATDDSFRERGC